MINRFQYPKQGKITLATINSSDILQINTQITVQWSANATAYPNVTLVLWDALADGLYYDQGAAYDQQPNNGSVKWIVPSVANGRYHLGVGPGPPNGMFNFSESGIFTISEGSNSSSAPPTSTPSNSLTPTDTSNPTRTPTFASVNSPAPGHSSERNLFMALLMVVLVIMGTVVVV